MRLGVQRRADGNVEAVDGRYLYFIVFVSRLVASRRCLGQQNEIVDQRNFILGSRECISRFLYNSAAPVNIASLIPPP
jgi:hypothetical protein